jgi:hypothetical protein
MHSTVLFILLHGWQTGLVLSHFCRQHAAKKKGGEGQNTYQFALSKQRANQRRSGWAWTTYLQARQAAPLWRTFADLRLSLADITDLRGTCDRLTWHQGVPSAHRVSAAIERLAGKLSTTRLSKSNLASGPVAGDRTPHAVLSTNTLRNESHTTPGDCAASSPRHKPFVL